MPQDIFIKPRKAAKNVSVAPTAVLVQKRIAVAADVIVINKKAFDKSPACGRGFKVAILKYTSLRFTQFPIL